MNNSKSDFTQGSILGKLIPFMMPILGALILQAAYGAVDLLVVGRFGTTEGLSAVSTGSQVLNLVTFVITQFAMGVTVLIARYIGEKKPEQIGALIGGAIVVFTMISVVLFIVMIVFSRQIAVIMQAPKEAVGLTSVYVKICGSGIFFIVAYNLLSAIFRGLGDSKSPLIFVAVACVINIVGDIVLVAGFNMNAAGAAALVGAIGIVNGLGRLAWSTLSDWMGRAATYVFFFVIETAAFFALAQTPSEAVFYILVLTIISCYGGGFSCMPAFLSDLFGVRQLSSIHGIMLTAWALAGIAGPMLLSVIKETTGSYHQTMLVFAGLMAAALLLSVILKVKSSKH